MATNHAPDSPNLLTDTQISHSVNKKNEHDVSPDTSDPPRKRSHSVLHWLQKTFTNVKGTHEHSFTRKRAATTTSIIPTTTRPRTGSQSTIVPIDKQSLIPSGRARSHTVGSVGSTNKKIAQPKIILRDTDEAAHQRLSGIRFFP